MMSLDGPQKKIINPVTFQLCQQLLPQEMGFCYFMPVVSKALLLFCTVKGVTERSWRCSDI